MKTWRDAEIWASHAEDSGIDCPVCGDKISGFGPSLGEIVDLVIAHLVSAHGSPQDVDNSPVQRLARESLQRGIDEHNRIHPEQPARLAGDQLPYGGPA
jgi:hypothetical protein